MNYKVRNCSLCDVKIIEPLIYRDERGNFIKYYEKELFELLSLPNDISEVFVSTSVKNVIRGMHFQTHYPQAKFVTCLSGKIYDVIIDLRKDSETYLKWESFDLNSENNIILYVPRGFAHGFQACIDNAMVAYMNVGKYSKKFDSGIRFDDPNFKINWIDNGFEPIVSEKDKKLPYFDEKISFLNV